MSPWPRILRQVGALAWLTLAGCDESVGPLRPHIPVRVSPGDASPEQTIRSLEWSWNQKSVPVYRVLFTDDYRFAFSALDSYGSLWNREDEMVFAQHLFVGGKPTEAPATSIVLDLGRTLVLQPDPRPGKQNAWHKVVRTSVGLTVLFPDRATIVTGFATFYLVRGDSALVPAEIFPLGYTADSTRWYIDRWEDDTASSGAATRTMPTKNATIGQLKALYR
jgi:hypothetical protein